MPRETIYGEWFERKELRHIQFRVGLVPPTGLHKVQDDLAKYRGMCFGLVQAETHQGRRTGKWTALWQAAIDVDSKEMLPSKQQGLASAADAMGVVEQVFRDRNPDKDLRTPHTAPQITGKDPT